MIVLAGDIGGTNSRLALFEARGEGAQPPGAGTPRLVVQKTYPSRDHASLEDIAAIFLQDVGKGHDISRACFGIAGPVENNVGRATNLAWMVDGRVLQERLGIERVVLINDFSAAALAIPVLGPESLVALGGGPRVAGGPMAVLGAGTGLGEAFLVWSPAENKYHAVSSEGGHADFAPRTGIELALFQFLAHKHGRVSCERVLSGRGLVDIFTFLSQEPSCQALLRPETVAAVAAEDQDPAATISKRALEGRDPICELSLALFSSVLGAVAGNLGLYLLATGGVYVAGGIAPRILPFLQRGGFRQAFEAKGRLSPLVSKLPAFVVTHADPGLLGAATVAAGL